MNTMIKNRASQSRSNRRNPPKPKPWEIENQKKVARWEATTKWALTRTAEELSDIYVNKLKQFDGRNISSTDMHAIEQVLQQMLNHPNLITSHPYPVNPEDDAC